MKQLRAEIGHDFNRFINDYAQQLRNFTPVDKGTAKRGWQVVYRNQIGDRDNYSVIRNRVPYIDVLEKGHSKQAPRGMTEPALKRTRRPR